jgi:hypothetical protein
MIRLIFRFWVWSSESLLSTTTMRDYELGDSESKPVKLCQKAAHKSNLAHTTTQPLIILSPKVYMGLRPVSSN